jgi:hypothetical protein
LTTIDGQNVACSAGSTLVTSVFLGCAVSYLVVGRDVSGNTRVVAQVVVVIAGDTLDGRSLAIVGATISNNVSAGNLGAAATFEIVVSNALRAHIDRSVGQTVFNGFIGEDNAGSIGGI